MGQGNYKMRDVKGFMPSVDPTRSEELFVLNGKNYVFDSKGPKSSFGDRLLLPQPLAKPRHVQGIRIQTRTGTRCFTFTGDSILEWDESLGGWKVIYITADTSLTPNRWTWGYLNEKIYFCHPVPGILVYDPVTQICQPHLGVGVPTEALAINVSSGRLNVIDPVNFSWSAPADGMDFNPELGGAGFQEISQHVSGFPVMISHYARGVLVWTTGGVMRGEYAGDSAVYRFRPLNTEYRPVNSFCTTKIDDDTVVILDERGLYQSKGEAPTPFAPLFNEFLLGYIQKNKMTVGQNLRIEWDDRQKLMYILSSLSYANAAYEDCFVLYPNLDKWGQFNESVTGILPLKINSSERADDYFGFVDINGHVRYWQETGSRELQPDAPSTNLFYPVTTKPAIVDPDEGGRILSSSGVLNTTATSGMVMAGYYETGEVTPIVPQLRGLGAKIQIGLVRLVDNPVADQMAEVQNLQIRSVQSGPDDRVNVDYNLIPSGDPEDYSQGDGSEDYGFENLNYVNHGVRVIGTNDAVSEFYSAVPDLIGFMKGARLYACGVPGIWHIVELTASEIGEFFHPVTLEITACDSGRLL